MTVTLHVCVNCRGRPGMRGPAPSAVPPGRRLAQAVLRLTLADEAPLSDGPMPDLVPVACMNACAHGCNAALTDAGGRTRLVGGLGPGDAAALIGWARGGPQPGRLLAEIPPGEKPIPG